MEISDSNEKNVALKVADRYFFRKPIDSNGLIIDLKYVRKAFLNLNKCGATILLKDLLDFIKEKGKSNNGQQQQEGNN